jgi:hypothetical protein
MGNLVQLVLKLSEDVQQLRRDNEYLKHYLRRAPGRLLPSDSAPVLQYGSEPSSDILAKTLGVDTPLFLCNTQSCFSRSLLLFHTYRKSKHPQVGRESSSRPVSVATLSEAWVLAAWLLGSWVRIPLHVWRYSGIFVVLCCVVLYVIRVIEKTTENRKTGRGKKEGG